MRSIPRRSRHLARALLLACSLAVAAPVTVLAVEAPTPSPAVEPTAEPTPTATPPATTEPTAAPTAEPTVEPTPSPTDPPQPQLASILIANLDTQGTSDPIDDTLLDGAAFAVRKDDGDALLDAAGDALVFGPAPAVGGLIDTADLPLGWYWVIETTAPDGYAGSVPILVELNLDGTVSCFWDSHGPLDCHVNDVGSEELSWTVVLVDNVQQSGSPAPTRTPASTPGNTGGVEGATGRPSITLPPTDAGVAAGRPAAGTNGMLAALVLGLAAIGLLLLLPARQASRWGRHLRRRER